MASMRTTACSRPVRLPSLRQQAPSRQAPSSSTGMPSSLARTFAVPSGKTTRWAEDPTRASATVETVPSPPAAMIGSQPALDCRSDDRTHVVPLRRPRGSPPLPRPDAGWIASRTSATEHEPDLGLRTRESPGPPTSLPDSPRPDSIPGSSGCKSSLRNGLDDHCLEKSPRVSRARRMPDGQFHQSVAVANGPISKRISRAANRAGPDGVDGIRDSRWSRNFGDDLLQEVGVVLG